MPPLIRALQYLRRSSRLCFHCLLRVARDRKAALSPSVFFAGGCSGCKFGGPSPRHVFFQPGFVGSAARQSSGNNDCNRLLCFHDRDVRFAGNRNEIIRGITVHRSGRTEMKRYRDLVHSFPVEVQAAGSAGSQEHALQRRRAGSRCKHNRRFDLQLGRKLWRNLCEHFRLQLRQMTEERDIPPAV